MSVDRNTTLVSMAGLLHDLGKFYEKTDSGGLKLSPTTRKIQSDYRWSHAAYTAQALEDLDSHVHMNLQESLSDDARDNIKGLASYHHNPGTTLQKIITVADWCSSGMDREESELAYSVEGKKRIRLTPVFESIDLGGNPDPPGRFRYPISTLNPIDDSFFPQEESGGVDLTLKYEEHWNRFVAELQAIPETNEQRYLNDLTALLEKYTWCIPSTAQTGKLPDISLFDHSKTTAAIAAAIYGYHLAQDDFKSGINDDQLQKFLLVSGDVSGIQSYLFDLAKTNPKGATKILRGRSFYIGLLTRAAVHVILSKLGYTSINCILDAGGKFTLLLPNTASVKNKIADLEHEISRWCYESFFGRLTLLLDYSVTMSQSDFKKKRFASKLNEMSDSLAIKKLSKFDGVLQESEKWNAESFVAVDFTQFSGDRVCKFDDKSPAHRQVKFKEDDESEWVNDTNYSQFQVGDWLTKNTCVLWDDDSISGEFVDFFNGRIYANFFNEKKVLPISGLETIAINEYFPRKNDGDIKPFDKIAEASRWTDKDGTERGKDFLGVLKADVDDMGLIFSVGFKNFDAEAKNLLSISRYTTLSRMLNRFFADYLTNLRRNESDFQDIYSVYAGGDDLFIVGPWEKTIEFAKRIRDDFSRYCCGNPDIHLSAGIAIIKSRYPLRSAADLADELLEEAKISGKNRLNLFNTITDWSYFEKLAEFKIFLNSKLHDRSSNINSGFLRRLLQYYSMFSEAHTKDLKGNVNLQGLRFHSLMAYDIKRNIAQYNGRELQNPEEINQLYRLYSLKNIDTSLMKHLQLPLFWTIYKNRK